MHLYIWLYRIFSVGLLPFLLLMLLWRVWQKKEDKARIKERLGFVNLKLWREFIIAPNSNLEQSDNFSIKTAENHRIWIHAVSVGEANSSWILALRLLEFSPKIKILFTTTTLTSSEIIAQKIKSLSSSSFLANRVIHQFLPLDSFFCVEKFLGFWRPRACLLVESEIWPNLIFSTRSHGILSFLINARISERSTRRWFFAKKIGFKIFDYFAVIFAQSQIDQNRLQDLTKNVVLHYGNLKSQALELEYDLQKLEKLKSEIGTRKIWLCTSTHKGEEEELLKIHQRLRFDFPDLLTILVLRHPSRSIEVVELMSDKNFSTRSKNEKIEAKTEIYLVDSLGELGLFYRLADFAFIGGSIAAVGGHNPFEAIMLDCAIIVGQEVFNFAEIYEELAKKNLVFLAKNSEEIYQKIKEFLSDLSKANLIASKAKQEMNLSQNIAEKIIHKLDQILLLKQ